ncbi:MAG: hypothetical protein LBD79_04195 [Treponema sp.]|jgi:hypothetical protein|nr:hypothetical protein [Treponema sp.]
MGELIQREASIMYSAYCLVCSFPSLARRRYTRLWAWFSGKDLARLFCVLYAELVLDFAQVFMQGKAFFNFVGFSALENLDTDPNLVYHDVIPGYRIYG